ncbi:MAG: diaminopimelate decarboxylase [Pseudomonadales bacterium]
MEPIRYQAGELYMEGVPVSRIAEQFGTPTYLYSRQAIESAYHRFANAFSGRPAMVCYAVKANSNLAVLDLLARLGAGFDIVSGGELERVLAVGAPAARIVFSGVGKQTHEIARALEAGIACFNLESASELEHINRIAGECQKVAPISIRVNPNVDARTHPYISTGLKENKFGVPVTGARALYRTAAKMDHVEVAGIDCHIGSQITSLAPFLDAIEAILELVDELTRDGHNLRHIDLGGGIGVRYRDEPLVDINEYAGAVIQAMGRRPQELWFEPGRYIVANAGLLVARVITIKDNEGKHFAVIDAAMNDLIRPALYGAWQDVTPVVQRAGESVVYDVVGPVCETGDFLAKSRPLCIAEDDLVAIHDAGAYGFVMSSNYNSRGRAAEVIVSGDEIQCVRARETIEDQLRLEQKFKL